MHALRCCLIASIITLTACSASTRARNGPGHDVAAGSAHDDAAPALAQSASCPATYAEAVGTCQQGECQYPEGSCYCGEDPWCGGMAPPEGRPVSWQCTPVVRADGCPGSNPGGTPCAAEGKQCDYTCSCVEQSTCTGGTWVTTRGPCKP